MEIEPFVDANKAAEFLNLRPRRLLELAREGSIPAYPIGNGRRRIWRFRLSELASVLDLPPIFSPGITRLSPDLGAPTLHLQIRFHHLKSRLRTAEPCERSRTKPRSSAQTPRA